MLPRTSARRPPASGSRAPRWADRRAAARRAGSRPGARARGADRASIVTASSAREERERGLARLLCVAECGLRTVQAVRSPDRRRPARPRRLRARSAGAIPLRARQASRTAAHARRASSSAAAPPAPRRVRRVRRRGPGRRSPRGIRSRLPARRWNVAWAASMSTLSRIRSRPSSEIHVSAQTPSDSARPREHRLSSAGSARGSGVHSTDRSRATVRCRRAAERRATRPRSGARLLRPQPPLREQCDRFGIDGDREAVGRPPPRSVETGTARADAEHLAMRLRNALAARNSTRLHLVRDPAPILLAERKHW